METFAEKEIHKDRGGAEIQELSFLKYASELIWNGRNEVWLRFLHGNRSSSFVPCRFMVQPNDISYPHRHPATSLQISLRHLARGR